MTLFDSGVRPAIDEWLLAEAAKERDYGEYWSASSAGYCMRRNIFTRLGVPKVEKDDAARLQRVFTAGHLFHDWIQGITKKAGLSIASEVELQDEDLMIRGHFDDLVLMRFDENGETPVRMGSEQRASSLILYDYKTQNSRAFDYNRPMSYYHKLQLGTYMYMLRKLPDADTLTPGLTAKADLEMVKDLTEARILKIEKDTLRMQEEQLLWSEELESAVKNYWNTLNNYWNRQALPACSCHKHEGGFLAKEKWNGYFYEGQPCSIKWYEKFKATKGEKI